MFTIRQEHRGTDQSGQPVGDRLSSRLGATLALLFPLRCLGCQATIHRTRHEIADGSDSGMGSLFCGHCLEKGHTRIEPPFCDRCAKPMGSGVNPVSVCGDCIGMTGAVGRVRAVFSYEGIIKAGIHAFKYLGKKRAAPIFGSYMFDRFDQDFSGQSIDLIVPIPLHRSRLLQRGFNQSYLLVRQFMKLYQKRHGQNPAWVISPFCIQRKKKTRSQTGFDITQRSKNLEGAFHVKYPARVEGKHILLVDDVFTTGATASEAALTLTQAGAAKVDVLVLART